jgi:peptidoglycan/xylan/chitin deacetylase (PgdA/CDA1 family)
MKYLNTLVRGSRRQLAAVVAARFGLLQALRRARRGAPDLLVLAYHRVGSPEGCPVDGGLFSVTPEELALQVRLLRRWTHVATLDEVEAAYASGRGFDRPAALLTFDDTYRDNYQQAFPVLRDAGVSGVFFAPTGLIECGHVPWWDRIAYAVKHSRVEACRLEYPAGLELTALHTRPSAAVAALLARYKTDAALDQERFLEAIEAATGACAIGAPEVGELFARWSELREMAEGGMAIASHTHTHRLLGHLPYAEQYEELERSRDTLRERLGVETRTVAYPVGKRRHFNDDTRRALRELGYRLGFSHYNGWNPRPADPYDVRRVRIEPQVSPEVLEAAVSLPAVFARPNA